MSDTRSEGAKVHAAIVHLRKILGGPVGQFDFRPSMLGAAKDAIAYAKTLPHTEAIQQCDHCHIHYAATALVRLIGAVDHALNLLEKSP